MTSAMSPMSKPMRRSRYVTTLLMGAAAISLASCEQDNTKEADVGIYQSVEACAKDFPLRECQEGMEGAQKLHAETAPKFASAQECKDAGFEACEPTPPTTQTSAPQQQAQNSSGSFMPLLMGYMMGRAMGGGGLGYSAPGPQQPNAPTQASAGTAQAAPGSARPVYADRNGFLYTGDRQVSKLAPGQTLNPNGATNVRARVTPTGDIAGQRTVSRGGFGTTGTRMSGGS